MSKLTVICHANTGTVLAACSANDGQTLADLVGDGLPMIIGDTEVVVDPSDLRAFEIMPSNPLAVIENPRAYYAIPDAEDSTKVDFGKANNSFTLVYEGNNPKLTGLMKSTTTEPASVIIKLSNGKVVSENRQRGFNEDSVRFNIEAKTGEFVISMVRKYRPRCEKRS